MPPQRIEWIKFHGHTLTISVVNDIERRIYELRGYDIWEQLKESGAESLNLDLEKKKE